MDMQTLVNRIEEMRELSSGILEASKSEAGKKLNTNHYRGEVMAFDQLLIWLKSNGVSPDTQEVE